LLAAGLLVGQGEQDCETLISGAPNDPHQLERQLRNVLDDIIAPAVDPFRALSWDALASCIFGLVQRHGPLPFDQRI
jgi:hypothetical protein